MLRCTWVQALTLMGGARLLFVVGEGAPDANRSDVLATPVGEQMLMRRVGAKQVKKIKGVTSYSTYSLYAKTMHFLRHAATQPEPVVVLGDDDIFVQPHALLSYAWALLREAQRPGSPLGHGGGEWYAGRFDWYSWRTETMQATAYWRALRGALYGAMGAHGSSIARPPSLDLPLCVRGSNRALAEWYRNCSPTGAGWVRAADRKRVVREAPADAEPPHERCVGPFVRPLRIERKATRC